MTTPELVCRDEQRRRRARAVLNGLDYVEVSDDQRVLDIHFFRSAPTDLQAGNIQITGGSRIPRVRVLSVRPCHHDQHDYEERLAITVEQPGDFSFYTLSLVQVDGEGKPTDTPLDGFDPRYSQVRFTFKASCASDLDCRQPEICPPSPRAEPDIDYLAKDYASFRQLLLDRLAVIMPEWSERHVPDVGIAIVEVLAYVGDYLSYHQDAVATEAYISTARRRISVRRHARLVDYQLHEGTNARAWIHIRTTGNLVDDQALAPREVFFITADSDTSVYSRQMLTEDDIRNTPSDRYEVFEPLDQEKKIALYVDQNEIDFHTWGDRQCCLPKGTTRATLKDVAPPPSTPRPAESAGEDSGYASATGAKKSALEPSGHEQPPPRGLKKGDCLLFEEVRGPETGNPADADPSRRHVVRLTRVTQGFDQVERQSIIDVEWPEEDALPFDLCLSAIIESGCLPVATSVARGNMLAVDHGRTIADESLGVVPRTVIAAGCEGAYCAGDVTVRAGRFRPRLEQGPLIFSLPLDNKECPASQVVMQQPDARTALPAMRVTSIPPAPDGSGPLVPPELFLRGNFESFVPTLGNSKLAAHQYLRAWLGLRLRTLLTEARLGPAALGEALERLRQVWWYRADLFGSTGQDCHFVVEVDNEGRAYLRFGDGELGRQPEAGTAFTATYRVGSVNAGNVGAESISRMVFRGTVSGVELHPRNPLPAAGGTAPETLAEARLFAPHRFRTDRLRAVAAEDYAHLAGQHPKVQRAAAELRWTGSGYEALVAIDQRSRAEVDGALLTDITKRLDPFRRIGHTVRVVPARNVPLLIHLIICVLPNYIRGHVKAAILEVLSNRDLPGGGRGLFHPDTLSFGEPIYLSPIVAIVQALPGVESVIVKELSRLFDGPAGEVAPVLLPIGRLEIARLDNDPSFPENGRLELDMQGGR